MSAALIQCTLIAITSVALTTPTISAECNKHLQKAERGTLWEGDVVVDDQLKLMYGCQDSDKEYGLRQDEANGVHRSKGERSSVQSGSVKWEGGVLPYVIDSQSINADGIALVEKVIAIIESITSIQMPKWTEDDPSLPSLYIQYFKPNGGCGYSHIGQLSARNYGFIYGNPYTGQPVAVNPNCGEDTIFHETMHALGFIHEHSRADRDDFVEIMYDCITSSAFSNFNKAKSTDQTAYDYQSVMHYSAKAFSDKTKDNCTNTITALDESNQSLIGSCNYISACDVAGINLAYADIIDHEPSIECDSTCWCNIDLHSLGEAFGEDLYANIESCGHDEVLSTWALTSVSEPPSPALLPPPPLPPTPPPPSSGISSGDLNYSDLSMGLTRSICQDHDNNQVSCDDPAVCTDESLSDVIQDVCPRTCGFCSIPMMPFTRTDVVARIAWAFNSDLSIIELYINSADSKPVDGASNDEIKEEINRFQGRIICADDSEAQVLEISENGPMSQDIQIDVESDGSFVVQRTDNNKFSSDPSIIGQLHILFSSECTDVSIVNGVAHSINLSALAHCGTDGIPCYPPQYQLGDIDRDLAISIVDIVQMIDVVAGATGEFVVFGVPISFMAIEQQLLADMNMDEDINVMDVIDLILIIVDSGE